MSQGKVIFDSKLKYDIRQPKAGTKINLVRWFFLLQIGRFIMKLTMKFLEIKQIRWASFFDMVISLMLPDIKGPLIYTP